MLAGTFPMLAGLGTRLFETCHRFFISIFRAMVNEDGRGGLAPASPWFGLLGVGLKRRRPVEAVRRLRYVTWATEALDWELV